MIIEEIVKVFIDELQGPVGIHNILFSNNNHDCNNVISTRYKTWGFRLHTTNCFPGKKSLSKNPRRLVSIAPAETLLLKLLSDAVIG
jgi:hypothetical protein